MAQLRHIPTDPEDLRYRPRVYFACHPEDHTRYFEETVEELQKFSNCAVYYYAPEDELVLDEQFCAQLQSMNLIVMPVTRRLLYQPSCAMDSVFPYALSIPKPVLPLMQERGLEDKYREKFGDLQFLDKCNDDLTALPYEEKLKRYLRAQLVSDDQVKRIQSAFDAYVFLSYRKKDRKYAQELMRLLHRDPICRDIAIWYDEFLTPGEDFNKTILEALQKSKLFALVVTPNVLEKPNYVLDPEYKEANHLGKPVLPAQMLQTDAVALRDCCPEIPDAIDPANEPEMTRFILEAMKGIALRENDTDPSHNFLIGLAYLTGIDVEIDCDRAVELITGAAESGLTEAMEKLVTMYETGEGVQHDYYEAIRWRECLTEDAKQKYDSLGTEESARRYYTQLLALGTAWDAVSNSSKAEKTYEKVYTSAQALWDEQPAVWLGEILSSCYDRCGDKCLFVDTMDLSKAKEWYSKSYEIRKCINGDNEEITLRNLYFSYDRLGYICNQEGDRQSAKKWYAQCVEVSESLSLICKPKSYEAMIVCYVELGDLCMADREFTKAKFCYIKFVEYRESCFASESFMDKMMLATCCRNIGDICEEEESWEEAKKWHSKNKEILEDLVLHGKAFLLRNLAVSYERLGNIFETLGELTDAKTHYTKYLKICEKLVKPDDFQSQDDLAIAYFHLGLLEKDAKLLNHATQIYSKLIDLHPNIPILYQKLQTVVDIARSMEDE